MVPWSQLFIGSALILVTKQTGTTCALNSFKAHLPVNQKFEYVSCAPNALAFAYAVLYINLVNV